jgi:hypothetical protein
MKKIVLALLIILIVGIVSKDIYLVMKLSIYFSFWWSILLLVKYLSRDFNDGRKNDYFGE